MIACRISAATIVRFGSPVGVGEQALERAVGEEEAVGLVVGAVDRHADVVQEGAAGDDHLGIARRASRGRRRSRLDPGLDQQAQQPQGDVEDDLRVDPRVVRHPEPFGMDLGHVPPGPHLLVPVDRAQEALQLPVPRVGALTFRLRYRVLRKLPLRPFGFWRRNCPSSLIRSHRRKSGVAELKRASAANGPRAGARLGVEQRRSVVLLGFGSRRRIAGAAHRGPGAEVETELAVVAAVGGDRRRVVAGLTGADRVEGCL